MNFDSFKTWLTNDGRKPLVMGILNVTPDSFSDGGEYNVPQIAVQHAIKMEADGADIVDIGGESTRPGALPVDNEEELKRVIPVIEGIREQSEIVISIDTCKSDIAEKAILAGANIINDISGMQSDTKMVHIAKLFDTPVIIMHMLGNPQNMQHNPKYKNLMDDLHSFFIERVQYLTSNGISKNNIIIDPGIGFGKTVEHNFTILRELDKITKLRLPILVGPSRKSFIGATLDLPSEDRIEGTAVAVTTAILNGARIVRVHDIKAMVRVVKMTKKVCEIS